MKCRCLDSKIPSIICFLMVDSRQLIYRIVESELYVKAELAEKLNVDPAIITRDTYVVRKCNIK